jgi:hypothetical protein
MNVHRILPQVAFIDVFLVSFQGRSGRCLSIAVPCSLSFKLHSIPGLIIFFVFGTKYRYVRPIVHQLKRLRTRVRRSFLGGVEVVRSVGLHAQNS